MRGSNLVSALMITVILAVSNQAQYFKLPGSYSYAQNSVRQVMDISPDGKIAITLRNDPVSVHPAFLTTFDPLLGTQMDSKSFGFGPLGVQMAQVGNSLRAVVLTSQGGPRKIYLFSVSASGQLTELTSKELTTSNGDGGSNIVLSGTSQTGFVVVYPAAGLGGELVAFSLVDGSIVSRLPIDGIADTLVMSERPTGRLLACRTFDTLQIVDATNPAQLIKLTPVPLPRNADFNALPKDGIAFSFDARYVFVGNSLYDFATIDVAALQVISTIGGNLRFAGIKVFEDGQKRWLAVQGVTTGTAGISTILLVNATDPFHLSIVNQYNFGTEPFSYRSDFAFSNDGTKLFVVTTQKLIAFDLPGFSKAWEQPVPLSVLTEHQAIVHSQPDEVLGAWQVFDGFGFTSMLGAFPIVPPKISVSGLTTVEGNSGTPAANFTVTLEAATKHRLTVGYATSDGSALKGVDYVETSGTLTFEPGETTKAVSVPIVGDVFDEFDESFTLNLSNPNLGIIVTGQGTCVITDDDSRR